MQPKFNSKQEKTWDNNMKQEAKNTAHSPGEFKKAFLIEENEVRAWEMGAGERS